MYGIDKGGIRKPRMVDIKPINSLILNAYSPIYWAYMLIKILIECRSIITKS